MSTDPRDVHRADQNDGAITHTHETFARVAADLGAEAVPVDPAAMPRWAVVISERIRSAIRAGEITRCEHLGDSQTSHATIASPHLLVCTDCGEAAAYTEGSPTVCESCGTESALLGIVGMAIGPVVVAGFVCESCREVVR